MWSPFVRRRPHVVLEWDAAASKVVAARAQVGLSEAQAFTGAGGSRGMAAPPRLVDGFDVPDELLHLPDLNDVLSLETWETCLTQSEREHLSKYLPQGIDVDSTVEDLLNGENFKFGNPLQTWGEAVCEGSMHPDALQRRELDLKQEWKVYARRLAIYHGNMVQNLQQMKQVWEGCQDPEEFLRRVQRRPSSKKRKASKFSEDALMVSKTMPQGGETKKYKLQQSDEERNRPLMKSTGESKDVSVRSKTKSGQLNPLREDSKAMKIDNPAGGSKRLKLTAVEDGPRTLKIKLKDDGAKKVKPSDGMGRLEASTRLQMKPFEEAPRRSKPKTAEGGTKRPLVTPAGEERGVAQPKSSHEETKSLKLKSSDKGTRRLTFNPVAHGAVAPEIRGQDEMRRLQAHFVDNEQEMATRPKAKRQKVNSFEEGVHRLDSKESKEGPKKLHTKLSEAGRKMPQIIPTEEEDPRSRSKGRRTKVKASEDEIERRLFINAQEEEQKRIKVGPSVDRSKKRKIDPSDDAARTILGKPLGSGVKTTKVKASEGAPQKPRTQLTGDKMLLQRSNEKRAKAPAVPQGIRGQKAKRVEREQEEFGFSTSDFEGEWFKKYVQVTMGPLSSHKLSKAIQSVEVTPSMFEDVRRRSEAGEEVHIDTLHPTEEPPRKKKAPQKPGSLSGNERELIEKFWQTAVLSELPGAQALFIEKKEQHQKMALSFAIHCKALLEIEVNDWELQQDDAPRSGDISPEYERSPYERSPSSGEDWPARRADGSPRVGEEMMPIEAERSPDISGGSPDELDDTANVDEASQSEDELVSGGEMAAGGGNVSALGAEQSASLNSASEGSANGGELSTDPVGQAASEDEPSAGGADEASVSAGEPSESGSWPSGREGLPSPSRGVESSSGGGGSASGGEDPLPGNGDGERSPSGGEDEEPWPSGEDAMPNGDEGFHDGNEDALLGGDESFLSGDEGSQSGGAGSPSEGELD